jgi:hypothetical protein
MNEEMIKAALWEHLETGDFSIVSITPVSIEEATKYLDWQEVPDYLTDLIAQIVDVEITQDGKRKKYRIAKPTRDLVIMNT